MRRRKGFTLIELLLVIFIIGILATAAISTFGPHVRQGAWLAEARSNISRIRTAASAYYNQNSEYPSDVQTLVDAGLLDESATSKDGKWTYDIDPDGDGYKVIATKNKAPNYGSTVSVDASGKEDVKWQTGGAGGGTTGGGTP